MFEKALHGANIATCFAALATAADVTLTGGAATTIGAALSGVSLLKRADRQTKSMAEQMAQAFDDALAAQHLTGDRRKHVVQMVALFPPTEEDLARGSMTPATIAAHMRTQTEASASDPAHKTQTALDDYARIIAAVVTPLCVASDKNEAMLAELLKRSDDSGRADKLRDEGITEKAIIRLAQRISTETEDVGQAWLDLQTAMDIAVRVQEEGAVKSNHGDFVDTVLARVADLAKEGDYSAAGDAIDEALAKADAQVIRLLDSGVEVALLDGDTEKAAALLVRKADVEAGGVAEFDTLRALQHHYYEIGRDNGSTLDSMLAIDLAQINLGRAKSDLELVASNSDLGKALICLGERQRGETLIEFAIAAFNSALGNLRSDEDPKNRAGIRMDLGNALSSLGVRKASTKFTQMAVTTYEDALLDLSSGHNPIDWARVKINLGIARTELGIRENGVPMLRQAESAFVEAEGKLSRTSNALDWARNQINLGIVLKDIGIREGGTHDLRASETALSLAEEVLTKDSYPVEWAMIKANLGNVETALYDKTADPAHLDRAAEYVGAAREVFIDAGASHYIEMSDQQLAAIASRSPT